jgi:hypothetical protein
LDEKGEPSFGKANIWFSHGDTPWKTVGCLLRYFAADRENRRPIVHRHPLDAANLFHGSSDPADAATLGSIAETATLGMSLGGSWARVNAHILDGTLTVRSVVAAVTVALRQVFDDLTRQGDAIANGRAVPAAAEAVTVTTPAEPPAAGAVTTTTDDINVSAGTPTVSTAAATNDSPAATTKRVLKAFAPMELKKFACSILSGDYKLPESSQQPDAVAPIVFIKETRAPGVGGRVAQPMKREVCVGTPTETFRRLLLQKVRGKAAAPSIAWKETALSYEDDALFYLIKTWFKQLHVTAAYSATLPVHTVEATSRRGGGRPPLAPVIPPRRCEMSNVSPVAAVGGAEGHTGGAKRSRPG